MEASMTHPMISVIAVAALIVAGTVMLRSRSSIELWAGTAAMPTLQELHTMAGVDKLPVKELDD
jgi:hypothetical protein